MRRRCKDDLADYEVLASLTAPHTPAWGKWLCVIDAELCSNSGQRAFLLELLLPLALALSFTNAPLLVCKSSGMLIVSRKLGQTFFI